MSTAERYLYGRGGKWSAQVARLLEAARSPFDASAVAAVA
jgi:hypothetical protein